MTENEVWRDLGDWVRGRRLELRLSVREAARRAGIDRATWAGLEDGSRRTQDTKYAGIEDTLQMPHGSIMARLQGDAPSPTERPATRRSSHEDDDGWTDEDEDLYQALTQLLRAQGLKPTPAIIQAMREEWERERAEGNESDQTG